MKNDKKVRPGVNAGKGPVESLLLELNSHLREYIAALRAVTDNREYHNLAR